MNEIKDSDYKTEQSLYRSIKDWRPDDRPREKLVRLGADKLSDSELIAILIGHGTKGRSAIDLAKDLLSDYQNISKIAGLDVSEIKAIKGLGEAKAVTIAAAFELGKRIEIPPFEKKEKFVSPEIVFKYYGPRLRDKRVEVFIVLLLNSANQIIEEVKVNEGTLNSALVHAREVFRKAILENAASVILLHNHPSGNTQPSEADKIMTRSLIKAGEYIQIPVLDHIIIAGNKYISFKETGLI